MTDMDNRHYWAEITAHLRESRFKWPETVDMYPNTWPHGPVAVVQIPRHGQCVTLSAILDELTRDHAEYFAYPIEMLQALVTSQTQVDCSGVMSYTALLMILAEHLGYGIARHA